MAGRLGQETILFMLDIEESGEHSTQYECEECEEMFFFEATPGVAHPSFCPMCGRRAAIE